MGCKVPRLLPYNKLIDQVNSIDIGKTVDVREQFCKDLEDCEKVSGCFRPLLQFLPLLASFYLELEKETGEELLWFGEVNTFQVVLEGWGPFRERGHGMCMEMLVMEKKNYSINGREIRFKFSEFPNDLKMLAFLAGELPVSAKFFLTFGNVNTGDYDDPKGTFGKGNQHKWQPWRYSKRGQILSVLTRSGRSSSSLFFAHYYSRIFSTSIQILDAGLKWKKPISTKLDVSDTKELLLRVLLAATVPVVSVPNHVSTVITCYTSAKEINPSFVRLAMKQTPSSYKKLDRLEELLLLNFESGLNLSSSSAAASAGRSSSGFSKCLLLNTRSVCNKIFDLKTLLLTDPFDIVVLTETWLNNDFDDRELRLEDYNIFRRDRCHQRGGGLLLAIKSDQHCVRRYDLEVNTEMLVFELRISNSRCLLFAVFYRPPDIGESFLEEFKRFLNNVSTTGIADIVITGDFNFPSVDWSTGSPTTADSLTETFCEMHDDYFLIQTNFHVTRPYASSSTLSYGNILDLVLTNHESIIEGTTVTANFQDLILAAVNQHVPTMKLRRNPRPPWIDNDVLRLSKTKRLAEVMVYRSKAKSAKDPLGKASLFNEFFGSVFSTKISDESFIVLHSNVVNPDLLMDVSTSNIKVKDILSRLDTNKATGVDGISASILKECAQELSPPLTLLFNLSFSSRKVSSLWKKANITPVYKADANDVVENYRSISIPSIPSKFQEKIVHRALYSHVAPYLTDWQHGFIRGRSCASQLVLTHHYWTKALDDGLQVDVVFLDFAKSFDRVSHDILLQKLCNFGISGNLLNLCKDYLTDREQRVVIEGMSCSWTVIPSGLNDNTLEETSEFCDLGLVTTERGGEQKRNRNRQLREARRWVRQADVDINAAENDMNPVTPAYSWACYKSHQAAEKALKAALYSEGANVPRVHDLVEISTYLNDSELPSLASRLQNLVGDYARMRYPGRGVSPEVYTHQMAQSALQDAKTIVGHVKSRLNLRYVPERTGHKSMESLWLLSASNSIGQVKICVIAPTKVNRTHDYRATEKPSRLESGHG
ncbi:LINE-1 retrotransposable element ORF2 protein [Stylophora pistillata]|uniref:LINE-1 retrotransposable element ORF2 protein n=1 Tax=Stylophora pistillata TaxID=50429 RepID=A0A2B4SIK3_STYPI|nr:LINE-1 retrotransposable element ORF2 protein [Stylophora pistillata]